MLPGGLGGAAGEGSLRWAVYAGPRWQPTKGQWARLLDLQQEEERARIKRFYFERDAKLACVGRLMLHAAAVCALGAQRGEVRFARNKENKPYVVPVKGKERPGWNVNLSHHGEWVVLASDDQRLVGSDVMTTTMPREGEQLEVFFKDFDTTFTDREWQAIRGAGPEKEQLIMFFCNWALKETYLKATGIGLGIELNRVEFEISKDVLRKARSRHNVLVPGAAVMTIDGKTVPGWTYELAFVDDKHVMAVGLGPFSQEYGKSPSWPHVPLADGEDGRVGGWGGALGVEIKQVVDLLAEDSRDAYLALP